MKKKPKQHTPKEATNGNRNVERVVSEIFEDSIKKLRQISHKVKAKNMVDLEGAILRRRKSAVINTLPMAVERYSEDYPWIKMEEEWAICNSISMRSPQHMEESYCISLAMAIYILDALNHTHNLPDALPYLNWEQDDLDELWIPDVFDPCYGDDLLRDMTFLIQNRDCDDKEVYAYNNEVTANRHVPVAYHSAEFSTSLSYRDRFNSIMELVHPIYIERAVNRFVEKQWEFLSLFFKQDSEYIKNEQETGAAADKVVEQFQKCRARVEQLSKERKKSTRNLAAQKNPLLVKMPTIEEVSKEVFSGSGTSPIATTPYEMELHRLDALAEQGEHAEDAARDATVKHHHFVWFSSLTSLLQYPELKRYHGKAAANKFEAYTVIDPYEICFGYLCLLENGSDMAWLYQSVIAVLSAAVSKLPWLVNEEMDGPWQQEDDEEWDDEYDDGDWTEELYESNCKFPVIPKDYLTKRRGLYALKYKDGVMWPSNHGPSGKKINLPQFVYATTNMLMPRDMFEVPDYERDLVDAGVSKDKASCLAQYTKLASSVKYRAHNWNQFELDQEKQAPENTNTEVDETTTEELHKQIRMLKKKNDELRDALHDADKKVRDATEASKSTADAAKNEHQELIDLRELVFSLATGEEPNSETIADVVFPYHTVRNIVVFGGHATWLKAIQPMLPEVTFIEKDAQIGADVIRHADVVWIQSNAIGHAFFYKIVNVVRKHDVSLRYFGFASAEKCARQLIAVEKDAVKIEKRRT